MNMTGHATFLLNLLTMNLEIQTLKVKRTTSLTCCKYKLRHELIIFQNYNVDYPQGQDIMLLYVCPIILRLICHLKDYCISLLLDFKKKEEICSIKSVKR